MEEKVLREAVKKAIKQVITETQEKEQKKETFAPVEKEHLTENKKRLNEALLKEWGFVKKDKKEK